MSEDWQNWQSLSLKSPEALQQINTLLQQGIDLFKEALQTYKTLLQTTIAQQNDPQTATQNAVNQAIKEGVAAAKELINQIMLSTGCYVLLVPLPKKTLIRPELLNSTDKAGLSPSYFPAGPFFKDMNETTRQDLYNKIDFRYIFSPDASNIGGNMYLIKTVIESMYDGGDINRPRWQGKMYWGYGTVVIGGIDYSQVANLIVYLDKIFSGVTRNNNGSLDRGQTSYVPSNITVRIAYAEGVNNPHVIISWPPVSPKKNLPSFNSSRLIPIRMAIIRSTNFQICNAKLITDLFNTADIKENDTGTYGSTVITEGRFDAITSSFIDYTELVEGTTYYYIVTFKTKLITADSTIESPYHILSSIGQIKYSAKNTSTLSPSKPPDWIRTPSIASIIPPLAQAVYEITLLLDKLVAGSQSYVDRRQAYMAFIDEQINRYTTKTLNILNQIQRLLQIFIAPTVLIGGHVKIDTNYGTVSEFLTSYINAITDPIDPNRPKYEDGTEYITSLIFLAAAPGPAPVNNLVAACRALFEPLPADSPITTALNTINQNLNTVEQSVIDELAGPTSITSNTFNPDMTALPIGSPDPYCAAVAAARIPEVVIPVNPIPEGESGDCS
jgi:hypothetical protein